MGNIFKTAAKVFSPAYLAKSIIGKKEGPSKNPADSAMPFLNQIPQIAQQNLQPWQQQGLQAQQQNQQQYSQMASDPNAFYRQLQSTYTPSKGYQFKQDQMQKALGGLSAANGLRNTPGNDTAHAELVKNLLSEDENAYIDRLLGIQGSGLAGNEAIAGRGFGAAGDMANIHGSTLANQGLLAYKGQQNQNEQNQARRQMMMQLLGGLGGAALGAFGGPAGIAAGASVGSSLGGGPSNYQQFGGSLMGGR